MKLRNKILISTLFIWITFLIVTYLTANRYLLTSFQNLENQRLERDLIRVHSALDEMLQSLYTFTFDWAHWNDMYLYLQGKNPQFVSNNLNMTAFVNSKINLLTYWDSHKKLVVGLFIDLDKKKFVAYPAGIKNYLEPNSILFNHQLIDTRGLILVGNQIMMIAASPATNGEKTAAPIGTLITGSYFTAERLNQLQKATQINLSLLSLNTIQKNTALQTIFQTLKANGDQYFYRIKNMRTQLVYTLLKDINDQPIAMLRLHTPRELYLSGLRIVNYFLYGLIGLGIIFSILMLFLLENLIVKRLERLNHEVQNIGKNKTFNKRVYEKGKDELSSVATQINSMMNIIQASQETLEHRVKERTLELENTNKQLTKEIQERESIQIELGTHKEHLIRLAHYDNLTNLPNRIYFNEMLNKTLTHAAANNIKLAILYVDLDRFKKINDALGHYTGDIVIKEISKRFHKIIGPDDLLARFGGDEFFLLLNNIDHDEYPIEIAKKLLKACSKLLKIRTYEFVITASIGICIFPKDGDSLEDLERSADMAMYKAKKAGGSCYEFFTQELNLKAHHHIKLEAALRKAIENKEFLLLYQPKLDLKTARIESVEALIRWESPEMGLMNPAQFIPLAEETGLIIPIGEWALHEACVAAKRWQDQGYKPIAVAVNISAKQFRNIDIVELVRKTLEVTQLAPEYLELEITETAVMDDLKLTIEKLNKIKEMGVKIALDDFGTGYTSMNYLKSFPIDIIKIDQSFVKDIPANVNDVAIINAIIAMGHNLNMKIVAEGVETVEQLEFLSNHRCDLIQGYYLSMPLPEKKMVLQFEKLKH